ncbi:hypothetical protein PHYNN_229 [Pantoea phage Phynn]|nr:hypothetical protein PHYNN_229 [Pantoea phage Phynn]
MINRSSNGGFMELSTTSIARAFEERYINSTMPAEQKEELVYNTILISTLLSRLKGFTAAEVVSLAKDAYQLEVIAQSK